MINKEIEAAGCKILKKLQLLDINSLHISDYNKKYLGGFGFSSQFQKGIKAKIKYFLKKYILRRKYPKQYIQIMNVLLQDKKINDLQNMSFLDHGGGTGLLSLLAAELGFGYVYYNDIYDVSCNDSACISEILGYNSIIRISGDFNEIKNYCSKHDVLFNCIGSYDVIEHIYDINGFLESIASICAPKSMVFLLSGANSYNKSIVKELSTTHEKIENENREYTFGHKERDSLQSYVSIRAEIIKNEYKAQYLPEPIDEEMETLVKSTRGLIHQDIKKAIQLYITKGILPQADIDFPTNTCDPLTGNWAEHLMDFSKLLIILKKSFNNCFIFPDVKKLPKAKRIGLFASNE